MAIFRTTKKVASHLVDVRVDRWMSWGYLNDTAERFKILLLDIIIPKRPTHIESFDEAMSRLSLTEEDIAQRLMEFKRLFYFFIGLSVFIILYGIYQAFQSRLLPALIIFCIALYSLAQAFRYHFWIFQINQRKLGCTFKEWLNSQNAHLASQSEDDEDKTNKK